MALASVPLLIIDDFGMRKLPLTATEDLLEIVIRSLAFKWIRILFRCWKERKPYDEAVYLRALDARRPKKQLSAQPVELQWKNGAGFSKIAVAGV